MITSVILHSIADVETKIAAILGPTFRQVRDRIIFGYLDAHHIRRDAFIWIVDVFIGGLKVNNALFQLLHKVRIDKYLICHVEEVIIKTESIIYFQVPYPFHEQTWLAQTQAGTYCSLY
jgi:hypothetical protein